MQIHRRNPTVLLRILLIFLLTGCSIGIGHSQQREAPSPDQLTEAGGWELEQLLRGVLSDNIELNRQHAHLEASRARLRTTRRQWLPDTTLRGGYRYAGEDERFLVASPDSETESYIYTSPQQAVTVEFGLEATLWDWGRYGDSVAARQSQVDVVEASTDRTERRILLDAVRDYFQGVKASEYGVRLRYRLARLRELFQLASNLQKGGSESIRTSALTSLEILMARIEFEADEASLARDTAEAALNQMIADVDTTIDLSMRSLPPIGEPPAPVDEATESMEPGSEQELPGDGTGAESDSSSADTAYQADDGVDSPGSFPTARVLKHQKRALEHEMSAMRASRLPTVEFEASADYWDTLGSDHWESRIAQPRGLSSSEFPGLEPNPAWRVGLFVELSPLSIFRQTPEAAALSWEVEGIQHRLASEAQLYRQERNQLRRELQLLARHVDRLRDLQDKARRRYAQLVDDFSIGLASLVEIVEEVREWQRLEDRLLSTVARYHVADFRWQQMMQDTSK